MDYGYVAIRGLRRAGSVRPARLVPVPANTGFRDLTPCTREPGGSRAHILLPRVGTAGIKVLLAGVGREPGRGSHIARDLENPGYLGCSTCLIYKSRNM